MTEAMLLLSILSSGLIGGLMYGWTAWPPSLNPQKTRSLVPAATAPTGTVLAC